MKSGYVVDEVWVEHHQRVLELFSVEEAVERFAGQLEVFEFLFAGLESVVDFLEDGGSQSLDVCVVQHFFGVPGEAAVVVGRVSGDVVEVVDCSLFVVLEEQFFAVVPPDLDVLDLFFELHQVVAWSAEATIDLFFVEVQAGGFFGEVFVLVADLEAFVDVSDVVEGASG